jgi:hypothetical protein
VTISRDVNADNSDYPVVSTIEYFSHRKECHQLAPRMMVVFQSKEVKDNRQKRPTTGSGLQTTKSSSSSSSVINSNSNTNIGTGTNTANSSSEFSTRRMGGSALASSSSLASGPVSVSAVRNVTQQARDLGGLLREWLNDYIEAMKNFSTSAKHFLDYRLSDHEHQKQQQQQQQQSMKNSSSTNVTMIFSLLSADGSFYFPARLYDDKRDCAISLCDEIKDDSAAEQQRIHIREGYVTFGKVLNYIFRDNEAGVQIPQSLAPMLLLKFLIYGLDGLRSGRYMSYEELESSVLEIDVGFASTKKYWKTEYNGSAVAFFDEFVLPVVLTPRLEALNAIKEGFDIVPLSSHLKLFSWEELLRLFVGMEQYEFKDIRELVIVDPDPINKLLIGREQFAEIVIEALLQLDSEETRALVKFSTGSTLVRTHGDARTEIVIIPRDVSVKEGSRYPKWPLVRSHTCVSTMYIPYTAATLSKWTVANVLENIRISLSADCTEFRDDL